MVARRAHAAGYYTDSSLDLLQTVAVSLSREQPVYHMDYVYNSKY